MFGLQCISKTIILIKVSLTCLLIYLSILKEEQEWYVNKSVKGILLGILNMHDNLVRVFLKCYILHVMLSQQKRLTVFETYL